MINFPSTVRDMACMVAGENPQLALALVREAPLLTPNSYEVRAEFANGDIGEERQGAFLSRLYADSWVQDVTYTIERPSYAVGSALKPLFDRWARETPSIEVNGEVDGVDTYTFTRNWVPLENIVTPAGRPYAPGFLRHRGIVFQRDSTPYLRFRLTRALEQTEVPYVLRMTFLTWEMQHCRIGAVTRMEAIAALQELGIMGAGNMTPGACKR